MLRIPNVIGIYRLRGDGHDESGNGLHASTVVDMAWTEARGVKTPVFNGTSSHFATVDSALTDTYNASFSVSFWEYCTITPGTIGCWFARNDAVDSAARSWDVPFYSAGDRYFYVVTNVVFNVAWTTGVWHHWVFVNDYANNKRLQYLDGVKHATEGAWGNVTTGSNYMFTIGASVGGNGWWYKGMMQDVIVTRSALTQDQVTQLYRREKIHA